MKTSWLLPALSPTLGRSRCLEELLHLWGHDSHPGWAEEEIWGLFTRQQSSCLCSAFIHPHSKCKHISPAAPLLPVPPPPLEMRFVACCNSSLTVFEPCFLVGRCRGTIYPMDLLPAPPPIRKGNFIPLTMPFSPHSTLLTLAMSR